MSPTAHIPRRSPSPEPSSSRVPSTRTSLLSNDTPPTSMSGSFYHAENHCHCKLANEAVLRDLYHEHANSTEGLWNGPIPLSEWKDQFLPPAGVATAHEIDWKSVPTVNGQTAFADCIRENGLCTTVLPLATHAVHGKDHVADVYHSLDFAILSQELEMDHDSRRTRDELLASTLAFGVLASEDFDPCAFGNGKPDTDKAASMRGRLSATVQAVAANSHRTFVYAFILMPELARLVRFDHSGIVYSELFPWRTSCDLADFIMRFDHMSAAERGCDTSVTFISSDSEEVLRAKEILARCDTLPAGVKKSTIIPSSHKGQLSLMHVYDDEEKVFHRVVVHRAVSSAECFTGRATRGYYGVDLDEDIVAYVKDAWRINSLATAPEAATYRRLSEKNVPNLAGFYLGGDVPINTPTLSPSSETTPDVVSQTTDCSYDFIKAHPEYMRQGDVPGARLRLYVHHRLLFKRIGRPLKTFASTRQLCTVLLDAIEAHGAAYEHAKVLHRDISGGNILIDKDGRGVLIDWDMCVWLENKEEVERVGQKVGTWRFISADLLQNLTPRPHLLRDDLESFVHVLYYFVLRYRPIMPDGPEKTKLLAGVRDVFDDVLPAGKSGVVGGWEKSKVLLGHGPFPSQFIAKQVKPLALAALMHDIRGIFTPLYMSDPSDELAVFDADPDTLQRRKEELAASRQRLQSSDYLASRFRHWLHNYQKPGHPDLKWLPNDGAADQYRSTEPVHDNASHASRSSRKRASETEDNAAPAAKARRLSADCTSAGVAARTPGR